MTGKIYAGKAEADGALNRGWLVGHFMPDGDIRRSEDVEIKWGVHPAGERREQWVTQEARTSLHVLISGRFTIETPDQAIELAQPGEYVMLHQVGHSWHANEDSVLLSVRWPSVPGYAVPSP